MSCGPVSAAAARLQMGVRAGQLGLTTHSAIDAWTGARTLLGSLSQAAPSVPATSAASSLFNGSSASALNAFLASSTSYVRVTSVSISVDQPIDLIRDGVTLDLGATQLLATVSLPYMVRVINARNVMVSGGRFMQGSSAILVTKSAAVVIDQTQISGLSGDGIVVTASHNVTIMHNRISGLGAAGVLLSGGASMCTVEQNDVNLGQGQSNWNAGIVVTDRDVDLSSDPMALFLPGNYWPVYEPIRQRLNPPRDCLIAFNHIATNASSGIYMDGGVRFTIYSNTIQGNAKEGMCLDNGATANVVTSNVIQQNGNRWGQTDDTLKMDFAFVRLPDGTSAAKLPGISIDNAIYNIVFANNISHNFGGGVKMVRTAFFNVVGMNVIENDNDGVNIDFRFFGVQLGATPADASTSEIDFAPSRGNVIVSNLIRGTHGSGIFIQLDSDDNELIDNVIREATDFAIESVLTMPNTAVNNLTDLPSQNISSGCCSSGVRPGPVRSPLREIIRR